MSEFVCLKLGSTALICIFPTCACGIDVDVVHRRHCHICGGSQGQTFDRLSNIWSRRLTSCRKSP